VAARSERRDARRELAEIDETFAALAHASRRQILLVLWHHGGRMTAGEIANRFGCSWPTTTRHLQKLESAGLVRRAVRGRDHVLSLNAAPLSEAAAWIAHYQRFWEDRLEALDRFATRKQPQQRKPK